MKKVLATAAVMSVSFLIGLAAPVGAQETESDFNACLLRTVMLTEDGGGYYTGRKPTEDFDSNAWEGMDMAVSIEEENVVVDISKARPSFCSSGTYMALLQSLWAWDTQGSLSAEAWESLKPYTVEDRQWPIQDDGVGCWGRANANGPGLAVLVAQLKAGTNTYLAPKDTYSSEEEYFSAWKSLVPGDFLKLFWNEYIGANDEASESGHMVIFLDLEEIVDENGEKDGIVYYWSSNGAGYMPDKGYGVGKARLTSIYRAVGTRIEDPAAFENAKDLAPDNEDPWLSALNGRHLGTEEELLAAIRGEIVEPAEEAAEEAVEEETAK